MSDYGEPAPIQLVSVNSAMRQLSVGKTLLFEILGRAEISSCKIGSRRLVAQASIDAFISRRLTEIPKQSSGAE